MMNEFTDQLGRKIQLAKAPARIVSLVPSQTELLHALGLESEVVGITKFCVHPEDWFQSKTRVGGTKNIDRKKIDALKPDLIIANKEENFREEIESLMSDYPVWVSDVRTLRQALEMIRGIGKLTGTDSLARKLADDIELGFDQLRPESVKRTAYFIWNSPLMSINSDTFIHEMLELAGFDNVFGSATSRYPETNFEELAELNPELILLSSEPYPFKEKHLAQFQDKLPSAKVKIVDGELFSWYGSRLKLSPGYFRELGNDSN